MHYRQQHLVHFSICNLHEPIMLKSYQMALITNVIGMDSETCTKQTTPYICIYQITWTKSINTKLIRIFLLSRCIWFPFHLNHMSLSYVNYFWLIVSHNCSFSMASNKIRTWKIIDSNILCTMLIDTSMFSIIPSKWFCCVLKFQFAN